jgi:hypothetical protein
MKLPAVPRVSYIMRTAAILIFVLVVSLICVARHASAADSTRTPVLVELFTSEGCSSCPPVDRLVTDLQQRQPIPGAQVILLSYHVDYWNQLGWSDRFSSHDYSARQERYAQLLVQDSVYTPELVINGKEGGPDRLNDDIRTASVSAQNVVLSLAPKQSQVIAISAHGPANGHAHIYAAVTEDGLTTSVRAGENGGRTLSHSGVVRRFTDLGQLDNGSFARDFTPALDPQWQRSKLTFVCFAQDTATGKVLGVAAQPISQLLK